MSIKDKFFGGFRGGSPGGVDTGDDLSRSRTQGSYGTTRGSASPPPGGTMKVPPGGRQWQDTRRGMSPLFQNPNPALAGLPWLTYAMRNWQNVPGAEGRLRGNLESNELQYNQVENVARQTSYGSGGHEGGVQKATRSQVPIERAGGQVGTLQEQEQWKTGVQEDRLAALLWPYVQEYNNAIASAYGLPPVSFGNNLSDWLAAANEITNTLSQSGWFTRGRSNRSDPNLGQSHQDTGEDLGQYGT